MLTVQLKKWGYDPIAVEDGTEAWALFQKEDAPKLVLLDWNMPNMNGLELTQKIRSLNEHSPPFIIIVTGVSEKESLITGLDAGANDFIIKPCPNEVLRARVNNGKRMIELQEKLQHESSHDSLTGIYNRRAIIDILLKEMARSKRKQEGLVVGFCDIDHFKKVNDTYGHLVGDQVLCGFARIVEKGLREYDSIGRWGGEEFLLIMPIRLSTDAVPLFERLRSRVEEAEIPTSAGNLKITISIGVTFLTGIETVDEVTATVDTNMYQAKSEGRNRICFTERIKAL